MTTYLSWPVSVRINISYVETLNFPAVIICNQNRYRKSKMPESVQNATNLTEILVNVAEPPASTWISKSDTAQFYLDLAHQKNDTVVEVGGSLRAGKALLGRNNLQSTSVNLFSNTLGRREKTCRCADTKSKYQHSTINIKREKNLL